LFNFDLKLFFKKKMKKYIRLEYTDGCVCTSLDVDGKEFNIDLTFKERKDICFKLVKEDIMDNHFYKQMLETYIECYEDNIGLNIKTEEWGEFIDYQLNDEKGKSYLLKAINTIPENNDWFFQELFCRTLESFGKYKDLGHCDCCGDHIRRYILKLNL